MDNEFEEEITAVENNESKEKEKLTPEETEKLKVMTDAFEIPAENDNAENTGIEESDGKSNAVKGSKTEDKNRKTKKGKDGIRNDY